MTLNPDSRSLSLQRDMRLFFTRLSRSPISRLAAVMLVVLAVSSPAFSGPIHDAARNGDVEKIKTLLNDTPDLVSSKDDKGDTPLHDAVIKGHKDVAELLLAHKADVNAKNNDGFTPLSLEAFIGHKDVAELLLAHNADVTAKNNIGYTPLYIAVVGNHKI